MSRTKRGTKGPGFDYWSRRANGAGKWLTAPGRVTKKILNRIARRKGKQDVPRVD